MQQATYRNSAVYAPFISFAASYGTFATVSFRLAGRHPDNTVNYEKIGLSPQPQRPVSLGLLKTRPDSNGVSL